MKMACVCVSKGGAVKLSPCPHDSVLPYVSLKNFELDDSS